MARGIFERIGKPQSLMLLLCCGLLATLGWTLIEAEGSRMAPAPAVSASGAAGPGSSADSHEGPIAGSPTGAALSGVLASLAAAAFPPMGLNPTATLPLLRAGAQLDPPATLPITAGQSWRYFKGLSSAPPAGWDAVGFDDAAWLQGPSGFGYGDGDDATDLSDMAGTYVSVYVRREFTIADAGAISGLVLMVDYDDGFVAYVNGAEVARSASMTAAGSPPAWNATATGHEATAGGGGPVEHIVIDASLLVTGTNVLAIQGHNQGTTSTDFTLIPSVFVQNAPPDAPSSPSPAPGQTGLSTVPELCVTVDDPEGVPLDITFFGREASGVSGEPFTIIALPDTQYYSASYPATYVAQTQWIRDNRVARNIAFTTELGDCTDQGGIQAQWTNADAAWSLLEDPVATGLADGLPFGIAVGNHDQSPNGAARSGTDENVTTALYNQNFPKGRFSARGYHGGNYPMPGFADSMDNHYELFSAGGMDFIIFHLEWDNTSCSWPSDGSAPVPPLTTCQSVLTWVRDTLTGVHANRRALITTHWMGTPSGGGTGTVAFSTQGQSIFNAIKSLPNVFLLLGGHLDQADHRTDLALDGHEIHTLISDYQSRPNGGNGWLRIMTFDPQADTIHIETWSPVLGRFINKLSDGTPSSHADNLAPTENEITLAYEMDAGLPFAPIGSDTGVPAGTQACVTWPGRQVATTYEWYAVASDGSSSTPGSRQSFTTTTACIDESECDDANPCTVDSCTGALCEHLPLAGCCQSAAECDDLNVCTDDACTGNVCFNTDNSGSCSDGNACTSADFCSGGGCVSGPPATCDDGNACTADSCSTLTGCSSDYSPVPGCCAADPDCDDGLIGTTDTCTAGTCSNAPATSCATPAECDDGDACTADTCAGGNTAGLAFPGSAGNRVEFPIGTGVDYLNDFGTGSFTIEGWVYTDGGAAALTGIFRAGRQQAFPQVVVQLTGTGNLQIAGSVETNTAGTQVDVVGPALTANTWTHVALVVDRTAGSQQLRLHVNGGAPTVTAAALWGTSPISWTTEASLLGAARDGSGNLINPFDGRLDEFRIWDHARTQAEIAAGMSTAIPAAPGLVHRWGMEEAAGATASDSAGAGHGTLTGPTWLTAASQIPALGPGVCQHAPVAGCCNAAVDCDDANPCTSDACVTNACQYEFLAGSSCDDGDPGTCSDTCIDSSVTDMEGTGSCAQASSITGGFIGTNVTWTHSYTPVTTPIVSATLTVDIGDADGYVMTLLAQGGAPIGTITGGDNGVPGAWACPDAWVGGSDNILVIPASLFADLADGSFQVSTTGGGSSPPGSYAINRSILRIEVASCQGSPVGCCTVDEDCDDVNPCTLDACLDGTCSNTSVPGTCDDGDICTTGDTCSGGICAGSAITCDDGDACTTDSCDPVSGCQSAPLSCDDGNACTDDACDPFSGCTHADNTAPCDDADACTADICSGGVCVGAPISTLCEDGDACSADACSTDAVQTALAFDGANDYVSMGTAAGLNLSPDFTLEAWFRWDGGGVATSTGSGGITAIPLLSKGRAEQDTPANLNMNYFAGIYLNGGAGRLAADFEDAATGLNHPVCAALSTPAITTGAWHHAAITYDDSVTAGWTIYLDGVALAVDTSCSTCAGGACTTKPGAVPEPNSIQRFALGSALTSAQPVEAPAGFFDGDLDEVRVWNLARTPAQVGDAMGRRITAAPGLRGRWGLDDAAGSLAEDSTGGGSSGTLKPAPPSDAPAWQAGAPALSAAECAYPAASDGTACTDGNECTVGEVCTSGMCGVGSPVPGCCTSSADCGDGDACTTDTCENSVCVQTPVPDCCDADADCDDGNVCTADACSTANDAAVDLRSTADYVDLGGDTAPSNFINNFGTSSFTIEGWVYADALTADLTSIFRAGRQGAFPQAVVQLRTSGGTWIAGSVETSSGVQSDAPAAFGAAAAITLNQWHHFALVVDRSIPQLRMYLNGNLAGTANPAWTSTWTINMPVADHTVLGATRDSAGGLINNLNGRVDEVRIWDHARTQTEIQADRSREILAAPGLVHRWGFNEAGGPPLDDPGAYDGTLQGGAARITTNLPVFGSDTCTWVPANEGGLCDDGTACTTADLCTGGACSGSPVSCDDTDACTVDSCDANTGCVFTPVVCDDGLFCNGGETCDPGSGCQSGASPCDDGSACTIDTCDEVQDTCQHEGAACTADILGAILYYRDAALNQEPAARPVAGISMDLSGTGTGVPDAAATDEAGAYAFTGKPAGETYQVRGARLGGFHGAISSFDAALVARSTVGLTSLSPGQSLAGDASGNGALSSLDASYIAQVAAGLIAQLPAGATLGSDWFLVPAPAPAPGQSVTNPDLPSGVNGMIHFMPLSVSAAGQDFRAGLLGDVSGNWVSVAPLLPGGPEAGALAMQTLPQSGNPSAPAREGGRLSLSDRRRGGPADRTVDVAIRVDQPLAALSFDLELGFDASALRVVNVMRGDAAAGFTLTPNTSRPGSLRISLFNAEPIDAAGDIVVVTFAVSPGARQNTDITLSGMADEGTIPLEVRGGRIRTVR